MVKKKFVIKAELLEQLSNIRADKERLLLFLPLYGGPGGLSPVSRRQ